MLFAWLAATQSDIRGRGWAVGGYCLIALSVFTLHPYRLAENEPLAPYFVARAAPRNILVISTQIEPQFPLTLQFGAHWAGRFAVQWFVPGALNGLRSTDCGRLPERCARYRQILRMATGITAEDITRERPDLVIFDQLSLFIQNPNDKLEPLFFEDKAFAAAMRSYAWQSSHHGYTVWARSGG